MSIRLLVNVLVAQAVILVSSAATITVSTSQLQQIDGFGFSQAFGRANELQSASSSIQKQALDYLFSTTTGAGFSILRNRIGSGGNGDSILPSSPGSPGGSPKYVWDNNDKGQVFVSKQAIAYGVKTIYADAWSAPGFMKTSGNEATPGLVLISNPYSLRLDTNLSGIYVVQRVILAHREIGDRRTPTCWSSMLSTMPSPASLSLILDF
jgi:O-glycosyl hydrolase